VLEWPWQVADVLKKREARSMRISVNLTPSEFAQLQLLAEAEGRSMSNLSLQAIQALLERQNCPK
jgi:DNA-binding response OmpR family regulator